MRKTLMTGLALCALSVGQLALADNHISDKQIETAVKARKAHMQLYAFHLGTLGAMAKDEAPYDAEAAQSAADAIATLAGLPQSGYWLPGSDNGSIENTRALPAIWAEGSDVGKKAQEFSAAVMAMQTAAGSGVDGLKAAMGPLGGACSACHKEYRQSDD